jgi:hypothetical protein
LRLLATGISGVTFDQPNYLECCTGTAYQM